MDNEADQLNDDARQWRIARAAILLMGDSGLRRAKAASACRENLRLSPYSTAAAPVWALTVIGKRRRQRTVPVSAATVRALRVHGADRGRDFDEAGEGGPLIAPLLTPGTRAAQDRHAGGEVTYAADALAHLVRSALRRLTLALVVAGPLSTEEVAQLTATSTHAFRHTFGTVAGDMPIDVVRAILGHASRADHADLRARGAAAHARGGRPLLRRRRLMDGILASRACGERRMECVAVSESSEINRRAAGTVSSE